MNATELPLLYVLETNEKTPEEVCISLVECIEKDPTSLTTLRSYLTSHIVTLTDGGIHNFFMMLECFLTENKSSIDEFYANKSNVYGPANRNKCEEVWNGDHIAYRCRTCGLSDSSCMCVGCFDPTQHENHDYRIYRCSYGGCCDCGDELAWRPSGFCCHHKETQTGTCQPFIPENETIRLTLVVDSILHFICIVIETIYDECTALASSTFTHKLDNGQYMQSVVATSFGSLSSASQNLLARMTLCLLWLQPLATCSSQHRAFVCRRLLEPIDGLHNIPNGRSDILSYWLTFGVLLPMDCCDALGVLYLKLLMDKDFKQSFTLRFLDAYVFYIRLYRSRPGIEADQKHISRYIDRLFCQLFHSTAQLHQIDSSPSRTQPLHGLVLTTNKALTFTESLVHFLFREVGQMLSDTTGVLPTLCTDHPFIKQRVYARFCSELRCLLVHPAFAHQAIASSFVVDEEVPENTIYSELLDTLSRMQWMDMQSKAQHRHIEYESDAWQAAFVLDYEIMLVWQAILDGYRHALRTIGPDTAWRYVKPVTAKLKAWWHSTGQHPAAHVNVQLQLNHYDQPNFFPLTNASMHLPLHHFFASLLDETHQYESSEILWSLINFEDRDFWFRCALNPLHVQYFVRGIKAHTWMYNGQSMFYQVVHYNSRHWRYHGLHNDLFLLQIAAAALPSSVFTTFMLSKWLKPALHDTPPRLLEEGLKLLLQIVLDPTKISASTPWTLLVRDVSHWLSAGPMTHSELHSKCDLRLVELVKASTHEEDEDILGRVLDQVGSLVCGTANSLADTSPQMVLRGVENGINSSSSYVLKPGLWDSICPLFECFTATERQKCEQNALASNKNTVLLPVLTTLHTAFKLSSGVHCLMATHILACRGVLALVYWVLKTQGADDDLVIVALYYLFIATSVLPVHQLTPPPYESTEPLLNVIATSFTGSTWWEHLTSEIADNENSISLLGLVRQRSSNPLAKAVLAIIQTKISLSRTVEANVVDTPVSQPMSSKERQAQILAKLKAKQDAFLINQLHAEKDALPLPNNEAFDEKPLIAGSTTPISQEDCCALCHDTKDSTLQLMGCLTPSTIASKATPPFHASGSRQCHLRLCGHVVHDKCIQSYLSSLHSSLNDERLLCREEQEYLCPVCRRLCNTLVPLHSADLAAFHSQVTALRGDSINQSSLVMELLLHNLFLSQLLLSPCIPATLTADDELKRQLPSSASTTIRYLYNLVEPTTEASIDIISVILQSLLPTPVSLHHITLEIQLMKLMRNLSMSAALTLEEVDRHCLPSIQQICILLYAIGSAPRYVGEEQCEFEIDRWLRFFGVRPLKGLLTHQTSSTGEVHSSIDEVLWFQHSSFSLIELPRLYVDIYLKYCQQNVTCSACGQVPMHPALCLLCGSMVCCYGQCCTDSNGTGECTRHAQSCGAGFGCFLLLRACTILLLLGNGRCCIWGSIYLDRNGEEDAYFRRGKSLYLNHERYISLTRLVIMHGFTESTKILQNTSRRDGLRY